MRRPWPLLTLTLLLWGPLTLVSCGSGDDDDSASDDDDAGPDDDDAGPDDDDAGPDDDDAGPDDDDAGPDDDDAGPDDDDDGAALAPVSGIVIDAEGAFTGLAGATVQVVDLPASAVTTEGSGEYTLEVAPGLFEVEAIFADRYTVIVTGDTENASLKKGGGVHPMMTTTTVAGLIQPLGVSQSTTDGMLWVMVMAGEDQPAVGASVAIGADNDGSVMVGGAGSSAGSDIAPDTFLVVYANVPAGTSTVTVTPPKGLTCNGASSVTVYAEKATLASYFCQ